MHQVYILYSQSLNKYYTCYTSQSIEARLVSHLGNHNGFTSKAKDWVVVYTKIFITKTVALRKERHIKSRGAKRIMLEVCRKFEKKSFNISYD